MNETISSVLVSRREVAAAEHRQVLAELARSGQSARVFAREHQIPYSTLCAWRQKERRKSDAISFAEVELSQSTAEGLVVELGQRARMRLCSEDQLPLAARLLKLLEA